MEGTLTWNKLFHHKRWVKTVAKQFQETDKNIYFNHAKWQRYPCHVRMWEAMPLFPVMDLTFFKDSFSNIRLEIHLGLSQWDHTDTITNISFHYCICRFKWHICILSAWELDKQLQQIGLECRRGTADLFVGFYNQPWHQGPAAIIGPMFLMPSFSCSIWQQRMLTAQLNSLNSDFLSDQKMTNEVFTLVDEHIMKMT